jgi:hypothetical protein
LNPLTAILGTDRQIKVFLGVAESRYQLGFGIDHETRFMKPSLAAPA